MATILSAKQSEDLQREVDRLRAALLDREVRLLEATLVATGEQARIMARVKLRREGLLPPE